MAITSSTWLGYITRGSILSILKLNNTRIDNYYKMHDQLIKHIAIKLAGDICDICRVTLIHNVQEQLNQALLENDD